jgi:hypothetical protein
MTTGALSSLGFGIARLVLVIVVLVVLVAVIALVVARYAAKTRRVRQGVFLGVSGTGLIFVFFLTWTWLQSVH